jgi:hypothetical protein
VPKLAVNFKVIFSRARGKFGEQKKALKSFIIIINYCIIIINAKSDYF